MYVLQGHAESLSTNTARLSMLYKHQHSCPAIRKCKKHCVSGLAQEEVCTFWINSNYPRELFGRKETYYFRFLNTMRFLQVEGSALS